MKFENLSEKAKKWLVSHNLEGRAVFLNEYPGTLEFALRKVYSNGYELNVIDLSKGSWETHGVSRFHLADKELNCRE